MLIGNIFVLRIFSVVRQVSHHHRAYRNIVVNTSFWPSCPCVLRLEEGVGLQEFWTVAAHNNNNNNNDKLRRKYYYYYYY